VGFETFQGNLSLLETLQKQLRAARLPHSLLFAGVDGVGKRTLARFLAKAVNCQFTNGTDFCDQCSSCRKINANSHPDYREVEPDGQFIKIEQTRELSREVFFRPFESRRRFFILNPAERLKEEAANSLLKTLEEPPETSHLILVTDRPDHILGTIRSRCQLYRFSPLPPELLQRILHEQEKIKVEQIPLLVRICGGSIGKALTLDMDEYLESRDAWLELLQNCIPELSHVRSLRTLASFSRMKESFDRHAGVLFNLIHDLFLLKLDSASPFLINIDLQENLRLLAQGTTQSHLQEAVKILDQMERGARRNLNRSLALDQLALRLSGSG
jgi:DNA polymerase-3 subunit delta'